MELVDTTRLVVVGEEIARTVRYSTEEIAAFARMTFDDNPLHLDPEVAKQGRFGRIIASGQQTSAILTGMLATYFSRNDDGVERRMLCLNMNFAFKAPVFAEQDVHLLWRVSAAEWNRSLKGMVVHLDGNARPPDGQPAVIARGTILVSHAQA